MPNFGVLIINKQMLTLFEIGHTIPAFAVAYAGFRGMFGHDVSLAATLTIAAFVFVCTAMAKRFFDTLETQQLAERRQE